MFAGIRHTVLLAFVCSLLALVVACDGTPELPPTSIPSPLSNPAPAHDIEATVEARLNEERAIEATVEAKEQIEIASTSQAVPTPDPISGLISAVDLISEFEQNPVPAAYRYAD